MFWKRLKTKHQLILIVLLALSLRLYGINWDAGQHLHPDERYNTMVATAIEWPSSLGEYLDPQISPLSPYNTDYKSYIYGTFPLFWVKASADLIGWGDYAHLHIVGRFWSALFDLGTLLLIFWIGKKIWDQQIGLLASALYAITVLAIQQSHFFTVDNFATFFVVASFAALIKLITRLSTSTTKNRKRSCYWLLLSGLVGISFGLAVASKISSLLFGGIIGLGFLLNWVREVWGVREFRDILNKTWRYIVLGLVFVITSYAAFRLVQPYAFASANWLDLAPQPDFWRALQFQREAMAGKVMFPPSYQWFNTIPYWFPLKNLMVWGLGLPLELAVLAGTLLLLYKLLRKLRILKGQGQKARTTVIAQTLLLVWPLGLFFYNGGNFVKTMRYFLPAIPFMVLIAAHALNWLLHRRSTPVGWVSTWLRAIGAGVLAGSLLWALAYVNIYSQDTTRVAASKWIYQNVPADSVIANEHWDDPLPLVLSVEETRNSNIEIRNYETFLMEVYNPDLNPKGLESESKIQQLYDNLQRADYLILSSPRASGSIGQLQKEFPVMTRYYKLLKAEQLGFQRVAKITSYPHLFGVKINDSLAEEAFWVYDHPPVEIYKKVKLPNYDRFTSLLTIPSHD